MVPREILKQQEKGGRDTKDVWTNWQPKEDHIIVGKFETKILKLLDDRLGCVLREVSFVCQSAPVTCCYNKIPEESK